MSETSNSQFAWYCVRTQPKREHIAAGQLSRLEQVDVFCPRIRFRRNTKRGKVWFDEALFPGYLFARFENPKNLRAVSGAIGVRGLVHFSGECATVPDYIVETLRSEADGTIIVRRPEMKAGDHALLTEGALRGLPALVTQVLPGGERVKILMEMLGTAVEVEVPMEALEPAA